MTAAIRQAPKRRGVELSMLIFAVLAVVAADAIVDENTQGHLAKDIVYYGVGFALIWLIAHLVVRLVAPYADPLLLPAVALLNGLGLVLIHRLDYAAATQARRAASRSRHRTRGCRSSGPASGWRCSSSCSSSSATTGCSRVTPTPWRWPASSCWCCPPYSRPASARSTARGCWIRLAGFSIQPGEFAKLALMIFFASYLVAKRDVLSLASRRVLGIDLPRGRDLGPVLLALADQPADPGAGERPRDSRCCSSGCSW